MNDILQNFESYAIKKCDAESAFNNSTKIERATIKTCLALLNKLNSEIPNTQKISKTYLDAGFHIEHTKKITDWCIIHCPKTIHYSHLAATIMIARLAQIETCIILFEKNNTPANLLTTLEFCGIPTEHAFEMNEEIAAELLKNIQKKGKGRLVLLGNTPKELAKIALQYKTPILLANNIENFTIENNNKINSTEKIQIQFCANLTTAEFTENTINVKCIPIK